VYFRYDQDQTVMVAANTGSEDRSIELGRFSERLSGFHSATNVLTGGDVSLDGSIMLAAKQTLVLELRK
jgi:hypothetical protein